MVRCQTDRRVQDFCTGAMCKCNSISHVWPFGYDMPVTLQHMVYFPGNFCMSTVQMSRKGFIFGRINVFNFQNVRKCLCLQLSIGDKLVRFYVSPQFRFLCSYNQRKSARATFPYKVEVVVALLRRAVSATKEISTACLLAVTGLSDNQVSECVL